MRFLLFLIFLCIAAGATAQQKQRREKNGYGTISAFAGFNSWNSMFGASTTFGVRPSKKLLTGVGIDLAKFKNISPFYIPVYADVKYSLSAGKSTEIFLVAQPGYGFFNRRYEYDQGVIHQSVEETGGFYLATGICAQLKGKKVSPLISLKYGLSQFSSNLNIENSRSVSSVLFNVGLAF